MEVLIPSEDGSVAAPKKYPDESRERAIRMVMDLRKDPITARGAMARGSQQLAVNKDTLRNWMRHAEVDAGLRSGTTTAERAM